jgi:hypothetical protein
MASRRNCAWISGPENTSIKLPAAKWWLAISRDVFAADYRRRTSTSRPSVKCHRTPTFCSPLDERTS